MSDGDKLARLCNHSAQSWWRDSQGVMHCDDCRGVIVQDEASGYWFRLLDGTEAVHVPPPRKHLVRDLPRWEMLAFGGCPTTSPDSPCCNPECKGEWGTGCPCCHFHDCPGRSFPSPRTEVKALRAALAEAVLAIRAMPSPVAQ
jgi:hypothetical protein